MDDHHLRVGNKADPLTNTPDAGRELFNRFNVQAKGFPLEAVVNAATNVLLNVLRQRNTSRNEAEKDFNEMFGRMKAILLAHYDSVNGNRRSVFPFHQTIEMPFLDFKTYPRDGKTH